MENDILAVWSRACDLAKNNTRYAIISPWMSRLAPKSLDQDTLILVLDDPNLIPFLTEDHLRMIGEAASPAQPLRVSLTRKVAATSGSMVFSDAPINQSMTLDTFHAGISNRLAYAAIHAIIDQPGAQYNPVFIHGSIGMGKTHLLQSAYHGMVSNHESMQIRYINGALFITMVEAAMQANQIDAWREQFIAMTDVLLFDDIDQIAGHTLAENELFAIFSAMYDANRQMVFAADCPPRRIRNFPERLSSRFHWGLIIELEEMTPDMRRTIIRDKMAQQGIDVPDDVQEFLAQQVTTNIRELEGAILKLLGYSSLLNVPITLDIARSVLSEYLEESEHTPTIDDIQQTICDMMDVSLDALLSASRAHSVAYPRQIAMYLAREMTSTSLEEIGRRFGGRDHSTVKYGCEKIRELTEKDTRTRNTVRMIRERMSNGR